MKQKSALIYSIAGIFLALFLTQCSKRPYHELPVVRFDPEPGLKLIADYKRYRPEAPDLTDEESKQLAELIFPPDHVIEFDASSPLTFVDYHDVVLLTFQTKTRLSAKDPFYHYFSVFAILRKDDNNYPLDSSRLRWDDHNQMHLTPSKFDRLLLTGRGRQFAAKVASYGVTRRRGFADLAIIELKPL
jgi:hypothetical protein